MITHLNFDIETLGKTPSSVVLSLACVPFVFEDDMSYTELVDQSFYVKFDPKEQISSYKRTIDKDTIEWWSNQNEDARKVTKPSSEDVSLEEGLTALQTFIKNTNYKWNSGFVWCRGNYFDFPMIESLYNVAELKMPFNTWKIRDIRTMVDVLTGSDNGYGDLKNMKIDGFIPHHALHDAAADVMRMKAIFKSLL